MAKEEVFTSIYVYLLDEGTDVWRPVKAIHIKETIYQIDPDCEIPDHEIWQFLPSQKVRCEEKLLSSAICLVAIEKASDESY